MLRDDASPEELERWYRRTPEEIDTEKRENWNRRWAALRTPEHLAREPDLVPPGQGSGQAGVSGLRPTPLAGPSAFNRAASHGASNPVQATSAKRSMPPMGSEIPTVRDAPKPVRLRRMPDGTFEPVPGHVTGPFAFQEWARNIDWPGVVTDLLTTKFGAVAGSRLSATDKIDKYGLVGGLYALAKEAWDDAEDPKSPPHHRR